MSTRWSIPLVPCALLAASASAAAPAATAIRLQTTGELPFTAEELEQAAGARLAMSAETGATIVIVGPADEAGIQLQIGEQRMVVRVGARVGLAAARIVALAIAELMAETSRAAAPQPEPPRRGPAAPQPEPSRPVPVAEAEALAPPSRPAGRVSIALGASKGMDAAEPFTGSFEADATFRTPRFDVVGTLGLWAAPTRHPGRPDEASFVAGVVRVRAGWRSGPLQLLLGPFVAPYRLEGGVSDVGVLAGGGAALRVERRLAAAPKVTLFGSLQVDAFANRVSVSLIGAEPSFATPRVAAGLGVGIGWDLGS